VNTRLISASVLTLILAGCTGSAAPAASTAALTVVAPSAPVATAPVAPASPTAAPTPVLLTVDQAAAKYKLAANTFNKAVDAAYKKYGKRLTLKSQKAYWASEAKASDKFIDAVKAIAFPSDIQPDATRLIKAEIVAQRAALSASKATNIAQLNQRAAAADKAGAKSVDLAAILRDDLGLPPNV
jgi:hypothetical protein